VPASPRFGSSVASIDLAHGRSLRLFVAIDLSDAWRTALVEVATALEQVVPGATRWVRPEGIHLTLAFLGNQPASVVPAVERALQQAVANARPFTLTTASLGFFGSRRAPRVLWAGITDDPRGALADLQRQVAGALRAAQIPFDDRPFAPHITLGRPRTNASDLQLLTNHLTAGPEWEAAPSRVERIVLFQSQLHPAGSIYTPLFTEPLPLP
jgi:2'-5' RNA ligase